MALKGEAGQISLLSIFQTLNLNGQRGILVVQSHDVKRKILFSEEGVRLLLNQQGDEEPLKEVLGRLKLLTESQYKNVLSSKQDDKTSLGDFLLSRRIIDNEMIRGPIAQHILEYIFETFSWADAKYEFKSVKTYSHLEIISSPELLKEITFPVDAVLMEVSYREDEWKRIREVMPTGREIFTQVPPEQLKSQGENDSDIDPSLVQEIKGLINGERTALRVTDETVLSVFETYQVVALLVRSGEIRPLDFAELNDLAQRLKKQYKIQEAVDILEFLLLQDPDNSQSRLDLIDFLESKNPNHEKLPHHYQALVETFRKAGDYESLESVLDKIIKTDSHSLFAREMIFESHLSQGQMESAREAAYGIVEAAKASRSYFQGALILERVNAVFPNDVELLMEMATFHNLSSDRDRTLSCLRAAADIHEASGDLRRLRQVYERIVALDPTENAKLKRLQELERKQSQTFIQACTPTLIISFATALILGGIYWGTLNMLGSSVYAKADEDIERLVDLQAYNKAIQTLKELREVFPATLVNTKIEQRIEEVQSSQSRFKIEYSKRKEKEDVLLGSLLVKLEKLINKGKLEQVLVEIKKAKPDSLTQENQKVLQGIKSEILKTFKHSESLLKKAQEFTEAGKHNDAHPLYLKLITEFQNTPTGKNVKIPLVVQTLPPNVNVLLNGQNKGKTPCIVYYNPFEKFELKLEQTGFKTRVIRDPRNRKTGFNFTTDWAIKLHLLPTPIWKFQANGPIESQPLVTSDYIYIGTRKAEVLCINHTTGQSEWRFPIPASWDVSGPLVLHKDRLLVATYDSKVFALNPKTGKKIWEALPLGTKNAGPVFLSKPDEAGNITCTSLRVVASLSSSKGEVAWRKPIQNLVKGNAAIYKQQIVVTTRPGKVLFLSISKGELESTVALDAPMIQPGTPFGNQFYCVDTNGTVYCINLKTQKLTWKRPLKEKDLNQVTVGDELLLVTSKGGSIQAIDIESGNPRWERKVEDQFISNGLILRNQFIVGSQSGSLRCFDIHSGKPFWTFEGMGAIQTSPVSSKSGVYSGTSKGTLYKFNLSGSKQ